MVFGFQKVKADIKHEMECIRFSVNGSNRSEMSRETVKTYSAFLQNLTSVEDKKHDSSVWSARLLLSDQARKKGLLSSDPLQLSGIHFTAIHAHTQAHMHILHLQAVITWARVYVPCHWGPSGQTRVVSV